MQAEELHDTMLRIPAGPAGMEAELHVPAAACALVVLPRPGTSPPGEARLRTLLGDVGIGTLQVNLMTVDEAAADRRTGHVRLDAGLLGARAVAVVDWLAREAATASLALGIHAEGGAVAAALLAAGRRPLRVRALVGVGGRPEMAARMLSHVDAAVLLMVHAEHRRLLELNWNAATTLPESCHAEVRELVDAGGVARAAADWFQTHLPMGRRPGGWQGAAA
jgi:putative phosphoribosyl transferase